MLRENLFFPSWIAVKNVGNLILLIGTLFNSMLQVWFGVTLTGLRANWQLMQLFQIKLGLWLANNLPEIKEILKSFLNNYRRKYKKIYPCTYRVSTLVLVVSNSAPFGAFRAQFVSCRAFFGDPYRFQNIFGTFLHRLITFIFFLFWRYSCIVLILALPYLGSSGPFLGSSGLFLGFRLGSNSFLGPAYID